MSGESYRHLGHWAEATDLLAYDGQEELERMAGELAGLGWAEDAARETEELLLIIRQAQVRIETRAKRLYGVWRARNWWDSGDSGPDYLRAELAKYRGEEAADAAR